MTIRNVVLIKNFLLVAALVTSVPAQLGAQDSFTRLSDRSWAWISSDAHSSNGALFVGDNTALVVDPGLTPATARRFLDEARRVAGKPIRYAVTTHWHSDHAFGISCIANREFVWVAHAVVAERFAQSGIAMRDYLAENVTSDEDRRDLGDCTPATPDSLVTENLNVDLGGFAIELRATGPAHTAGDLVVWAPSERALVAGDIFLHRSSPYMRGGNPLTWVDVLDELVELQPLHVVAGHFGPSTPSDLVRFRDYVTTLVNGVQYAVARGVPTDSISSTINFSAFDDFAQLPEFGATFEDNIADIVRMMAGTARLESGTDFTVVAVLDVGLNPHQIAFSVDGRTAYVAAAGSDRVTLVSTETHAVVSSIDVAGTPLGVLELPSRNLAVTRFQDAEIARYTTDGTSIANLPTGGGPSLFSKALPGNLFLVSVEQTDRVWVFDASNFELLHYYPTGDRPFPPAATSDGRLAFVPGYNDGTVTVIDLLEKMVKKTIDVGTTPSGGAVLPGDREYAVAVRGENRIALVDTESLSVTGSITDGIGDSPFSVVVSIDGRFAFVNNTASHDISVIALPEKEVVARIPVGEIPIVMAVHPDGQTLWVSSEGSHELTIFSIPR